MSDTEAGLDADVYDAAHAAFETCSTVVSTDLDAAALAAEALRTAGELGFLDIHARSSRAGSPFSFRYAGRVAEAAGYWLVHPLVLHHLCAVAVADEALLPQAAYEGLTTGTVPSLFAWRESSTVCELIVPGVVDDAGGLFLATGSNAPEFIALDRFRLAQRDDRYRTATWGGTVVTLDNAAQGSGGLDDPGAAGEDVHGQELDMLPPDLLLAGALAGMYVLGGARRLVEISVQYAGQRVQFGQPIATFQALKHALADAEIALQHARALTLGVLTDAGAPSSDDDESIRDRVLAKIAADRAASAVAETALQVHGGIGFTWESMVHQYLKAFVDLAAAPLPSARMLTVAWRTAAAAAGSNR
ncbi:acyl-CoA dehydrogenase family protein [Streptomyces sp. NPDC001978]|uniref:acyl-CoA dehydrogenase family protein n=1 Tax=Streptomyces sp. NPDC001978 TaxID=3364627 RepID=UPI0036C76220